MSTSSTERVRKTREAMRAQGLRPVQIWVQDTRSPEFKAEISRHMALVTASDLADQDLLDFMDAALADILEVTPE